ncbi:MAG: DinB family protein [Hamadaea sp.]|nr:DinB family protein [Hamadaea sp.]NUR47158.1 DinB family protein [Hamadaea sp.]NUT02723.1 DinB family protein [Hamadaea sp.]
MTAPLVNRTKAPRHGEERTQLDAWLDFHRDTLIMKCAGLTDDQLRRQSVPPSTLSLLGLVRHMAEVERWWFRRQFDGADIGDLFCTEEDPDYDFNGSASSDPAADFAAFREEVEAARVTVTGRSLDETFVDGRGTTFDLRWVYLHMIEEYARHNGHADLLRECVDGETGA